MPLNMTKIAFGCDSLAALRARFRDRESGGPFGLTTRYRPKRADEMQGGSLYWIVNHLIAARSPILGFEDAPNGRTYIMLDPRLIPVMPLPKRAHQGWRYLEAASTPEDLASWDSSAAVLPPKLAKELARIGLF